MKWKNRLTNYNFWISIVSASLLIMQAFKIEFDIAYINEIATAVLGLLVMIGIVSDPTKTNSEVKEKRETTVKEEHDVAVKEEVVGNETKSSEDIKEQTPNVEENKDDLCPDEDDYKVAISKIMDDLNSVISKLKIDDTIEKELPKDEEIKEFETAEVADQCVENNSNIDANDILESAEAVSQDNEIKDILVGENNI